jgi:hypothetical protein
MMTSARGSEETDRKLNLITWARTARSGSLFSIATCRRCCGGVLCNAVEAFGSGPFLFLFHKVELLPSS